MVNSAPNKDDSSKLTLYAVEIKYGGYVLAESEEEAEEYVNEIVRDSTKPDELDVYKVEPGKNPLGWVPGCLVYHAGENDVKLGSVLP